MAALAAGIVGKDSGPQDSDTMQGLKPRKIGALFRHE